MDKEFANKIIDMYAKYGSQLDKKDVRGHFAVMGFMQEIRDRPVFSTYMLESAKQRPKLRKPCTKFSTEKSSK